MRDMNRCVTLWIFSVIFLFKVCAAQEACYPAGGVAGIVVATIIVTIVVGGLTTAVAWRFWTRKKDLGKRDRVEGQHHQQSQKTPTDFAFDNPYFRDPEGEDGDQVDKGKARSSINKNSIRSSKLSELSGKGKKPRSGKNHFMFGGGGGKKHRALDDSCLAVEPERTIVALRGHDFTGLGFNICGNMRDGILVKDVLHRGPASESGLIKAGDKIINVTVSFTNIVYEDALTILSYASPYDVQLEIERVPDKSRVIPNTPSGSKRLGSCSFNNSGQKLFHPLYRSQSIDDLTQIDKDTFPSHGIGPRRSQSVGVAAHKLAAHFKNSDSKLEDKDRNATPLILSTTGSLNEKMLANVMADGSLHKNGLQWEKRFEDTLESEDSGSNNDPQITKKDKKTHNKSPGILKSSVSNGNNASDSSDETANNSQNYMQKNLKYLDSPHTKGKLETYKSPGGKNGDTKMNAHQVENSNGRRAKTMAEASNALWELDQSIKDGDSGLDSSHNTSWNTAKREEVVSNKNSANVKNNRFMRREEENDSDVSRDSLELSNKRRINKKNKKSASNSHLNEFGIDDNSVHDCNSDMLENNSSTSVHKQNYQQKLKKNIHYTEGMKSKGHAVEITSKSEHSRNERVYANNVLNKTTMHNTPTNANVCNEGQNAERNDTDRDCYLDHSDIHHEKKDMDHKQSAVYVNQREIQDKLIINRSVQKTVASEPTGNYSKANGRNIYGERQKLSSSENFSQNYGCGNRIIVNGDVDEHKKFTSNSKCSYPQKNTSLCYQQQTKEDIIKSETDPRLIDKNKSNMNQKFIKKPSNPAGMFTQINPFQQPSRQKNANFKIWAGRDDTNKDTSVNGNEPHFSTPLSNSYMSTCDSSGSQNRRDMSETQSYGQRLGDVAKTVIISSYDSSAARSLGSVQNNPQTLNYRQQHK